MNSDITGVIVCVGELSLRDILCARLVCTEWSRGFKSPPLVHCTDMYGVLAFARRNEYEIHYAPVSVYLSDRHDKSVHTCRYVTMKFQPRRDFPPMWGMCTTGSTSSAREIFTGLFGDLSRFPIFYWDSALYIHTDPRISGGTIGNNVVRVPLIGYNPGDSLEDMILIKICSGYVAIHYEQRKNALSLGLSLMVHISKYTGRFCEKTRQSRRSCRKISVHYCRNCGDQRERGQSCAGDVPLA